MNKLHEFVEEELVKILKSTTDTPQRVRNSDISAHSKGNLLRSALKYSGAKLSSLLSTPPSLEKLRKELNARIEDITLTEYKGKDDDLPRDSFGINEYLDTNIYNDSLSLAFNNENPVEISTPKLSPHVLRLGEHSTKRKKRRIDNTTIHKINKRDIIRKYEDMCSKHKENLENFIIYPEEMKEMIEFFRDKNIESIHKVLPDTDIKEKNIVIEQEAQDSAKTESVNHFEIIDIPALNFDIPIDFDGSPSPIKSFTPIKSLQTTAFEENLRNQLKKTKICKFSMLMNGKNRDEVSKAFNSLLVLAYSSEIKISQACFFGEIKISKY